MKIRNIACLIVAALLPFFVLGCASGGLRNSIPGSAIKKGVESGKSFVVVSKQGVMPYEQVYRPYWPDAAVATSKDGKRAIPVELILPVIGQVVDAASATGADYYKTQREMYRYRTDVGVFNAEGLSKEVLHEILGNATRPNVDADRPAYRTTPLSYGEQPEVESDLADFEANEPADTDSVVEGDVTNTETVVKSKK